MDFTRAYGYKKAEKNLLDFNDLEHNALAIFNHEDPVRDYRQKYEYIFIDEYQDSNLLQETLLSAISREHNLFMVGDIKQSIYRFRRAEPALFLHKYQVFDTGDGADNVRIDLSRNFRSRRGILEGINYIFREVMSRDLGDIDYDDRACLYPGLPEDKRPGSGNRSMSAGKERGRYKERRRNRFGNRGIVRYYRRSKGGCPQDQRIGRERDL